MPVDQASLKGRIVTEMEGKGFTSSGQYSQVEQMATAIAAAVVDEIQQNAQVTVDSGSSAGTYQVT